MSSRLLVVFLLSGLHSSKAANCLAVQSVCGQDSVCGPIQNKYLGSCATAFSSKGPCNKLCKDTYDVLLGNDIGRGYYKCDCGSGTNSATCAEFTKNLLANCFSCGVQPPPPNVTCAAAQSSCIDSPRCTSRLSVYLTECRFAFRGINCSQQCNQSFYGVLGHPVGNLFYACDCGNDTVCQTSGVNLVRICYNNSFPSVPVQPEPTVSCGVSLASTTKAPSGSAASVGTSVLVVLFAIMGPLMLLAQ